LRHKGVTAQRLLKTPLPGEPAPSKARGVRGGYMSQGGSPPGRGQGWVYVARRIPSWEGSGVGIYRDIESTSLLLTDLKK